MKEDFEPNERHLKLHLEPPESIDMAKLFATTGVLYWKINLERQVEEGLYSKIRTDRGYTYEDTIEISRETLPDYDIKVTNFFKEHFHADEEIRFVLKGSGYFDVRDHQDRWIRIFVEAGDLIVLPAGIHHRFTLDTANYIKVNRLFVGEPVWSAINRPNEDHPARDQYREQLIRGFN
ncbi:hypothetical protein CHUAL_000817 [Chamberlinius hualienensis]